MLPPEATHHLIDALRKRNEHERIHEKGSDVLEVEMRVIWNEPAHAPWYFYAIFESLSSREGLRVGPLSQTTMEYHEGGLRRTLDGDTWMRKMPLSGHTFPHAGPWFGLRVALSRERGLTAEEASASSLPLEFVRVRERRSLWGLAEGWRVDFTHVVTHRHTERSHSYEIEVECEGTAPPEEVALAASTVLLAIAHAVGPTEQAMRDAIAARVRLFAAIPRSKLQGAVS